MVKFRELLDKMRGKQRNIENIMKLRDEKMRVNAMEEVESQGEMRREVEVGKIRKKIIGRFN
mgnify:CR=1 FL=1